MGAVAMLGTMYYDWNTSDGSYIATYDANTSDGR